MKKKNIGSSFDSWLREEGIYEEVSANAAKRVIARQVEAAMQKKGLTKTEMARQMHTSRAALDRLLDPDNAAVTLSTLQKAAIVVGREIRLEPDLRDATSDPRIQFPCRIATRTSFTNPLPPISQVFFVDCAQPSTGANPCFCRFLSRIANTQPAHRVC